MGVPFRAPYDTLLTSLLDAAALFVLKKLSVKDPDSFLFIVGLLDFRLRLPNFSLSMTPLRLGESSKADGDLGAWLRTLGGLCITAGEVGDLGDAGGLVAAAGMPVSICMNCLTSFSNMSFISAT